MDNDKEVVAKADYGRREITAPVLVPDYIDSQGDVISEEEVYKACRNFNKYCMQPNQQHELDLGPDIMEIVESYVTQKATDALPAGTWMMTMKCKSDELLDKVHRGEFNGYSIKALASMEYL